MHATMKASKSLGETTVPFDASNARTWSALEKREAMIARGGRGTVASEDFFLCFGLCFGLDSESDSEPESESESSRFKDFKDFAGAASDFGFGFCFGFGVGAGFEVGVGVGAGFGVGVGVGVGAGAGAGVGVKRCR